MMTKLFKPEQGGVFPQAREAVVNWAKARLPLIGESKPLVRVLMYPAAEQNPYLVVTKKSLEDLGARVTMLHDLESSELSLLALKHDVVHLFNIKEYQSPFNNPNLVSQVNHLARRLGHLWTARKLGLKVVWTLYNDPKGDFGSEWLEKLGRRWMFDQADRIICSSMATQKQLRERYPDLPERKVVHIAHHNFGDYYPQQVSRRQALSHLGIEPRGRVFICFGGIHPYKGLTDIIPLFGRHPLKDHTLIIAGAPSNKHYASTIEGLCARYENVHPFIRYIARDEVQYYLQAADVFVMPYKDVINSGSMMLALRFNKPIIAPRVGSIPEVLTPHCSLLLEQPGATELKNVLVKSLELDLDKAISEARRISEAYSAERLARRLMNTYLDLFPRRPKIPEEAEIL